MHRNGLNNAAWCGKSVHDFAYNCNTRNSFLNIVADNDEMITGWNNRSNNRVSVQVFNKAVTSGETTSSFVPMNFNRI